jgi:hypothetical protein
MENVPTSAVDYAKMLRVGRIYVPKYGFTFSLRAYIKN